MLRTLSRYIGDYKRDTILTPIFSALEVLMEILIPFITASIIDKGIEAGNLHNVYCRCPACQRGQLYPTAPERLPDHAER